MPLTVFDIETYGIRLGFSGSISNTQITLNGADGEGTAYSVVIKFSSNHPLPEDAYNASARMYLSFVPFQHLPHYVDLLRNEAPLKASFNKEHPAGCMIYTGHETPGEGEE
ncbi:MAG TPA: hypothetical protein PKM27_06155 [Saprospiraceae bacterium]|nr:hypothetical protein [Saprospiraceae bacterium]HNT21683.1 hypothetical protein [Saprospiraceae bacterium]